jgi:hypothetical protein
VTVSTIICQKLREDLEYVRVSFLHYCNAHDDI